MRSLISQQKKLLKRFVGLKQIFEGRYVTARKVDDYAYLVVAKSSWYAFPRAPVPFYRDEAATDGSGLVTDWDAFPDGTTWLEAAAAAGPAVPACDCADVKYVVGDSLDDFTVVVAISMRDVVAARIEPSTREVVATARPTRPSTRLATRSI